MWPLLALSLISLTLILERFYFWIRTNGGDTQYKLDQLNQHLLTGRHQEARQLIDTDNSIYADIVRKILADDAQPASASAAIESQRARLERFMPTLGTVITAAPMLGILGTVIGIIRAFKGLPDAQQMTDMTMVSQGISEALLTTVAGLIVALIVLFPFNAFRAQISRTLGKIEVLAESAAGGNNTPPQFNPSNAPD